MFLRSAGRFSSWVLLVEKFLRQRFPLPLHDTKPQPAVVFSELLMLSTKCELKALSRPEMWGLRKGFPAANFPRERFRQGVSDDAPRSLQLPRGSLSWLCKSLCLPNPRRSFRECTLAFLVTKAVRKRPIGIRGSCIFLLWWVLLWLVGSREDDFRRYRERQQEKRNGSGGAESLSVSFRRRLTAAASV